MKITPKHVQYYGERKFHKHLKNPQISIHQLINPPNIELVLKRPLKSSNTGDHMAQHVKFKWSVHDFCEHFVERN